MASNLSSTRLGEAKSSDMGTDTSGDAARSVTALPMPDSRSHIQDFFVEKNGLRYAGTHLLIDFWGAHHLTDMTVVETALRDAVAACAATLINLHLHRFEPNGGISGVAVLAESHISVHTWPEHDYAAFDIFMCGQCDPYRALPALERAFAPERMQLGEHKRGLTR